MRYRIAERTDAPRIRELLAEMLRTVYSLPEESSVEAFLTGNMDRFFDGKGHRIFVAEAAGEIAGFLSVEHHGTFLYLDDFSVGAACRGRGIGTRLLAMAETYAQECGLHRIELHVEDRNVRALALYQRLDYRITETESNRHRMRKERIT